ncbi:tetratricopeptide repeat protein [Ferruginibacter profundus]
MKKILLSFLFFNVAFCLAQDSSEVYYSSGLAAKNKGNYKEASILFTKVLLKDSSNHNAFAERASCYSSLKLYPKAIGDYTQAIRLAPKNGNYVRQRAMVYTDTDDYTNALNDFNKCYQLFPLSIYLNDIAVLNMKFKKFDLAAAAFSRYIQKNNYDYRAYYSRGLAYFLTEKYAEAITDFEIAQKIGGSDFKPDFDYKKEAVELMKK